MNQMEKFLNFGAVVKINRSYDDEIFKFIELIKSVGFLNEYIEHFEKNCCFNKEINEFSEDTFWHYVELNDGNKNDTCLEFQWAKGFTWGNGKDYLEYDNDMEIITVDELIKACNKEELFNMNYKYTGFRQELDNKEIANELDGFAIFYDWSICKYPDGKYNIKDEQCDTFDFEENTTLEDIIDRVYFRMLDYFMDEDIDSLMEDKKFEYVKNKFETYMKFGKQLKLLDEEKEKNYTNDFKEIVSKYPKKDSIEISKDI